MDNYEAIRQRLLERRNEITERLSRVTEDLRHARQPLDADFEEQAIERENDEVLVALDQSMRGELVQVEATLARIEKGEYGICSVCREEISLRRLEVLPHTNMCIACAEANQT
jgi:RNA polymerase-binding protein DksA